MEQCFKGDAPLSLRTVARRSGLKRKVAGAILRKQATRVPYHVAGSGKSDGTLWRLKQQKPLEEE